MEQDAQTLKNSGISGRAPFLVSLVIKAWLFQK